MIDPNVDPNADPNDPNGQPPAPEPGNDGGDGGQGAAGSPTEFIEVKGVKIPAGEFETLAREKYKDRFEAFDNREKWQAENTKRAQENAEKIRKAELYDRMMADSRFSNNNQQPRSEYDNLKQEYIREQREFFPDADPNALERYLGKQFDAHAKLAGFKAQESLQPMQERQAEEFETRFLEAHPKLTRGSEQYQEIAELVGRGVNAEKAYAIVFQDDILKDKTESAIKARDEERLRKLKQTKAPSSGSGIRPKTANEAFEKNWALYGDK